ncbi:MAG: TolC family protein [Porphyromonas sp.]|nr:TolC family protein [Porphyromonas sp.]
MKQYFYHNFFICVCIVLCAILPVSRQDVQAQTDSIAQTLTLEQAIELAQAQSVDAVVALDRLRTAYWQYRTYRAELLPEVNFTGELPNYKSGYNLYQEGDGSYKFVRSRLLQASGSLSIDQNIPFTGGRISVVSSLEYVRPFTKANHFLTIPATITLVQPILGYNALRWQTKIQPVKYEEAKASYLEEREKTTMRTIAHFFELLLADENLRIAIQNRDNAKKLHEVAKAKREMGQISENELLQLELNLLQANGKETEARSLRNGKLFRLKSFLGITAEGDLHPVVPASVETKRIHYADVLAKAHKNNSFVHRIRRKQLEVDSEVARAKGERYKVDLFASLGYTGQHEQWREAYGNLQENQIVQVGVRIPLLDWGKRKARVKMAESARDVMRSQIKQETQQFDQDLFLLVEQLNNQAQQLHIARSADRIAEKRYKTGIETFMIGKISTLELNDAQKARDEARQKHISELFFYWYYFYQVRSLTLFDYIEESEISYDADLFKRL